MTGKQLEAFIKKHRQKRVVIKLNSEILQRKIVT